MIAEVQARGKGRFNPAGGASGCPSISWPGQCSTSPRALDLGALPAGYRSDGHGRPAYEPSMMMGLLLYA
jgi:hypothetical protein